MIFYFTGTGNSLYAARKLADEGEQIISIVDALRSKAFHYTLKEGEKLGFLLHNCQVPVFRVAGLEQMKRDVLTVQTAAKAVADPGHEFHIPGTA